MSRLKTLTLHKSQCLLRLLIMRFIKIKLAMLIIGLSIINASPIQGQATLNNIFSTYSSNIKVCNTPHYRSCIYKTGTIYATKNGNKLTLEYNFEDINKCKIIIDLCTATFTNGFWSKNFGKWEHNGQKNIITIEDENGIDLYSTGLQDYNQGTKQNLVSFICFDMGTTPIANRTISEFLELQQGYKQKDPWLLTETQLDSPKAETKSTVSTVKKKVSVKKVASRKATPTSKKTKSKKYGQ